MKSRAGCPPASLNGCCPIGVTPTSYHQQTSFDRLCNSHYNQFCLPSNNVLMVREGIHPCIAALQSWAHRRASVSVPTTAVNPGSLIGPRQFSASSAWSNVWVPAILAMSSRPRIGTTFAQRAGRGMKPKSFPIAGRSASASRWQAATATF